MKKNYFVAVGRLEYQKAYWKLIKAIKILKEKYSIKIKVKILGEGEYADRLGKLIRELSLEEDVELMGYVHNPIEIIANSLGMIFSSYYEGFPITVLESFSVKTPVFGARCSIPDDVDLFQTSNFEKFFYNNINYEENFNPNVFEDDDKKLAFSIYEAVTNDALLERMAETGYMWVKNNCPISNFSNYIL